MKQTINLLPAKAKQSKDLLAFNNVVIVLGLTFFVGISFISGLWWQSNNLQDQNSLQLSKNALLQNQLSQLSSQLTERVTPQTLTDQLSTLQNQIQAMQQVSELSVTIDENQSRGFLATLQKVDQSLPATTSIERLTINSEKHLEQIAGEITDIKALPVILSALKEQGFLTKLTKTSGVNNGNFYRF